MRYYYSVIIVALAMFVAPKGFGQQTDTTSFTVSGLCGQCKERIEKAVDVKGVTHANWDAASGLLSLSFEPSVISLQKIHEKIAAVGHDTELKKATDKAYEALPECCRYRNPANQHAAEAIPSDADPNTIVGIVLSKDTKGNLTPLQGASIEWVGANIGTATDVHGVFRLSRQDSLHQMAISYTGFKEDTIQVADENELHIVLSQGKDLQEVKVTARRRGTYVSAASAFRIANITSNELLKAACCNLSESFETNPSVDVSYSDAVTGSKQIQLLGLSGNYTQLTVENLPGPRGLATPLGLNSIAGPWVESIQLSKGTGSVVNGFESIAGQINVELRKPENSDRLYANGYINSMGKTDLNLNLAQKLGSKWSTGLLLHNDFVYNKTDFNKDGFRDQPTGNQFSAINRWKFDNGKGFMFQFGAKALIDDKTGGELDYRVSDKFSTDRYGVGIKTNRYEGWAKIGYIFPGKIYRSIGLQLSAFDHQQDAYFGLKPYTAHQSDFYSNLIYQDIIGNSKHKFKTGLSFSADKYKETYLQDNFKRKELVPGAFLEYSYNLNEHFDLVAGIRADHNSLYGWFASPRLNVRYEPVEGTTIRVSAGRGQRTANVFAENIGALVSSRNVVLPVDANSTGKAYGLDPEVAWNKGISVDQKLKLFSRTATIAVDFCRNDFENQVVTDLEDARTVKFYNLHGKSYSNSLQAEFDFSPVKNFDVRTAYRFFDVKSTYDGILRQRPFTARHRGFTNLAYALNSWSFDFTVNIVGSKRIPSTIGNPAEYVLEDHSPAYATINAQVSKSFGPDKKFELYLGGENLGNYFQQTSILAADDPFGKYFDASMVWGPVTGRLVYAGFRYKIK